MGRRSLFGTLGVGLMAVGATVLGVRNGHPPALVLWPALALLVVDVFLTVAALLGLPPARPEIDADHAQALRELALRLGSSSDPYRSASERQMLKAHRPDLDRL